MLVWICNPDLSILDFQSTGTALKSNDGRDYKSRLTECHSQPDWEPRSAHEYLLNEGNL